MTPRKDSSSAIPPINAQRVVIEDHILKHTGIPAVFAQLLKQTSVKSNIAFAIRGGLPFQRYMMPCAPKPVSVKAKTGNWGFTKGVIAENNDLGKVEDKAGTIVIKPREQKDLPQKPGIVETTTHKLSLREVVAGLETGDFDFVSARDGRLIVTATDAPTASNMEFSINLMESAPRVERQLAIENIERVSQNLQTIKKPDWWEDKWGDFTKATDNYFPAQMRDANLPQSKFEDIKIYGVPNGGKILPITGDQDLLWISAPVKEQDTKGKFSQVYNTFDSRNVEDLVLARIKMASDLVKSNPTAAHAEIQDVLAISNASIARLGCITAFESKVIDDVNKSFEKSVPHMLDLFQHGAENRNPGKPSPLDAPMIHIWRGEIKLTNNENELINFVMQKDYLENNIIDIHPQWDMKKWGAVVEKQYQLQQPIPPLTMTAFLDHKKNILPPAFSKTSNVSSTVHMAKLFSPTQPASQLQPRAKVILPPIKPTRNFNEEKIQSPIAAKSDILDETKEQPTPVMPRRMR
jgi:hypothetical protein